MNSYVIGVDIGGTNTDAVLVDQKDNIICAVKTTTTEDISMGFRAVLRELLKKAAVSPDNIQGVFLGTTHATNAILQKKDLLRVGVIRIAGQKPDTLPVAFAWPQDLRETVIGGFETISGGFECHGGPLTPLCLEETRLAIQQLLEKQVEAIAIVGVFSPLNGGQEQVVAALIREMAGKDFPISLSYEIGGIGFIERENSTILNASLKGVMKLGFSSLQIACQELGLLCPLMITQNDGSLMELERAIDYPVLTISAGPTNSFIGGARLSQLEDVIVVDIGGTSTDVGLVRRGFPIRSLNKSNIGGIALNFPMPDVLSVALGGGSIVDLSSSALKIGPVSAGKSLSTEALSFGGNCLTLTDVALVLGYIAIDLSNPPRDAVSSEQGRAVFDQVRDRIQELTVKIRGEYKDIPIVFVGGGSSLLPSDFFQEDRRLPDFFNVANAYGAALAEISGTIDATVSLQNRSEMLDKLGAQARQKAMDQGADRGTLKLVDQQIIPYSYAPNQMARVIIRYSGKRKSAD